MTGLTLSNRAAVPALRVTTSVLKRLKALAHEGFPYEVCGLLIGGETRNLTLVERITQAGNLATERRADRYRLDPDDFLEADIAARRDGLEIVGIWHTHPDHPSRPSVTDLEAAWEGYSYVIVSVGARGVHDTRSWRLAGNEFVEQSIEETRS